MAWSPLIATWQMYRLRQAVTSRFATLRQKYNCQFAKYSCSALRLWNIAHKWALIKGTHNNGKDFLTNRKNPWAESKDFKDLLLKNQFPRTQEDLKLKGPLELWFQYPLTDDCGHTFTTILFCELFLLIFGSACTVCVCVCDEGCLPLGSQSVTLPCGSRYCLVVFCTASAPSSGFVLEVRALQVFRYYYYYPARVPELPTHEYTCQ